MRRLHIIMVFLSPMTGFAQYDTSYVMRFPGRLGIAFYQSSPAYELHLHNRDTDPNAFKQLDFKTQARYITGLGLHYDKISLFAGIKTPGESDPRKGDTKSSQFSIAFTGLRLRLEGSLRNYTGFYENNSPVNDPLYTDSSNYYQNSDMKTSSVKLKGFYFLNRKKKFSYGAAYINNTRQLKSAGSFLATSNIYQYQVKNNGPIIPPYLDSAFAPYSSTDKLKVTGVSLGIGYTHTFIIFKRLFLNLLLAGSVENHTLNLFENDASLFKKNRTIFSAYDFRSSLGFNSNRFYCSFHTIIDGNVYTVNNIIVENNFINAIAIIGYRFGVKIKAIDKFEEK